MSRRRNVAYALLALDVIVALIVFNLLAVARGLPLTGPLLGPLTLPIAALVIAIYLIEGYRTQSDMLSVDYTSQHTIAVVGAMAATVLLVYAFVPTASDYALHSSRGVILAGFLVLVPVTLGYRRVIYLRTLAHRGQRSLVFLGDVASCELFRAECEKMASHQPVIYCTSGSDTPPPFSSDSIVLHSFPQTLADIEGGRLPVEAIVLRETARELPAEISRRLVQLYFSGVPTYTLELFHQVHWRKIPIYRLNQTWLFQEGFQIAREPVFERIKRASDIGLACCGLILASPFLVLAAIAVWLEDRGPVFFAQTRIGRNHAPFRLLKLRSMRVSGKDGDPYTRTGDPRITRVGRFLRASRLDELPQLWNVLVGEMSLIGPRAEWDRLVGEYERDIPCYHFRHLVKPGITGWAQVNYPYGANREDTIRKLEYDLYYIRHFSFLLDASIVLKTLHIMLFGKGR